MIVKILGVLDILAALVFWLTIFKIIPSTVILLFAFYLLVKGVFFLIYKDIASILDIICSGIIFISLNFPVPKAFIIPIAFFLIQKGIFSLVA